MSKQWVKDQVHRNEIAVLLERVWAWALSHREAALGLGLTLLVGLFLAVYSVARYQDLERTAWERLAIAQSYAFAGQGKAALDQLRALEEQFPRTRAARFGKLFQGDLLYQSGSYKEAIEAYQRCLDMGDSGLEAFALSGIAFAEEAAGHYDKAVEAAQRFLSSHPDHFLAPHVHAGIARSYISLGKSSEARATLEKTALLYPETFWAQWAQNQIQVLSTPITSKSQGGKPAKAMQSSAQVSPVAASSQPVIKPAAPQPSQKQ